MIQTDKIIQGHVLAELRKLTDESVDCVLTSPPYWALRDYETDPEVWDAQEGCSHDWDEKKQKWHSDRGQGEKKEVDDEFQIDGTISDTCRKCSAWRGSLGQEPDPELFVKHLCDVFDEVKRILKKGGTCFVNLGDTYSATRWSENAGTSFMAKGKNSKKNHVIEKKTDLPDKCLVQIPSRFAIEMTRRGWILRNKIIWHKPNAMPSSATDRFTVDFEEIFFFTKNQKYEFEQQFEKAEMNRWGGNEFKVKNGLEYRDNMMPEKRNKRCVWSIPTKPYPEAHFAVFPEDLCFIPIQAGCPKEGIVLDPFMGAGTTGLVAKKLKRHYIGIELNPEYIKQAEQRINAIPWPLF